ncbi:caspase-14-like isoform X1 [Amia ocellicauda]|uniref:caspase-14-like isoform X1 n=1 Tax=Amia ocellicauda TaxID=2972642 RepID=UPI003464A967
MMAEDEGGITSQVNQETCYDMSGRRMALVLCMKEGRPGAHCDLTTLRSLLTNYKFDLTEMIDPTSKDVIPKIMEFRDEINQRRWEVSCCMVVIMAHGQYGRIKAADGGSVKLEDIFNVFDNHQCPELRQKPRAFVVQACRGDVFSFNPNVTDAANIQDEGPPTLKIPSFCDTLCVYATPPGREARRSPSSGCPVIEEMGRVFEESADRDDLFELFTKVNRRLDDVDLNEAVQKDRDPMAMLNAPPSRSWPSKVNESVKDLMVKPGVSPMAKHLPVPEDKLVSVSVSGPVKETHPLQACRVVDRADGRLTLHIQSTLTKKWYL